MGLLSFCVHRLLEFNLRRKFVHMIGEVKDFIRMHRVRPEISMTFAESSSICTYTIVEVKEFIKMQRVYAKLNAIGDVKCDRGKILKRNFK